MKKVTFFALCFAGLLNACGGESSKDVCSNNEECGHGKCSYGACECDGLYTVDANGFCTQCMEGYINNGTACIKNTTTCSTDDVCGIGGADRAEKAENFIRWIEEMKKEMEIPVGADMIRDEDVEQIITWALAEANPLYPVPVVWGREDFRRLIATLRA